MHERILIVAAEQQNGRMRELLTQQGFVVTIFDDANAAYDELLRSEFNLVIVNLSHLTEGQDLIKRIRAKAEPGPISILAIGEWGSGQPTMALIQGADAFEPAPVDDERLLAAVAKLMRPKLTMIARASAVDADPD